MELASVHTGIVNIGESKHISLRIETGTIAGEASRRNEDSLIARVVDGKGLFGVFDGTTSLRPLSWLSDQGITGAEFAASFVRDYFSSLTVLQSPKDMLLNANDALGERVMRMPGTKLNDTHSLPATLATLCVIDPVRNTISVGHVGDSFIIIYRVDDSSTLVTPDLNEKFDDSIFQLIRDIAAERRISNKDARQTPEVADALYSMFISRNNRVDGTGSGVINGDRNVRSYIYEAEFPLSGVGDILLGSDGLVPPGERAKDVSVRQVASYILRRDGIKGLFAWKREIEDSDLNWDRVRYKHSDDATAIWLRFDSVP